jgi:hypothetical protein
MYLTNAANGKDFCGKTSRIPASQLPLAGGADVLAFEARRACSTISRHILVMLAKGRLTIDTRCGEPRTDEQSEVSTNATGRRRKTN